MLRLYYFEKITHTCKITTGSNPAGLAIGVTLFCLDTSVCCCSCCGCICCECGITGCCCMSEALEVGTAGGAMMGCNAALPI